MNESIIAYFGGDTKGLRRATDEAGTVIKGFSREAKGFLGDVGKGLLGAALFAEFIKLGKQAVGEAQKLRDESDKIGKPIDAATRSLAEFGDGMSALKSGAVSAVGFIIGGWTQLTDAIIGAGQAMLGFERATDAELKQFKAIEQQAEQTFKAIAKWREDNSPEKLAAAEAKLAEQRRTNSMAEKNAGAQYLTLMLERRELEAQIAASGNQNTVKTIALKTDLLKKELEIAKAKEKWDKEEMDRKEQMAKQDAAFTSAGEADQKRVDAWTDSTIAKTEAKAAAQKTVTVAVVETTAAIKTEAEVAAAAHEAFIKQKKAEAAAISARNSIRGVGTSEGKFGEASDAELREIVRRNRIAEDQAAQSAQRSPSAGVTVGAMNEQARLAAERMNAEQELQFRQGLRQTASVGGEDLARRQFQGDPLQFEQVFRQIVGTAGGGMGQDEKTKQSIQDIAGILKKKLGS